MNVIQTDRDAVIAALARLVPLALSDTGQARRVANFLLAWWNGPDLGDFAIADLFALDTDVARDIATVIGILAKHPGALYIDALGYSHEIQQIIALWRKDIAVNAA